LPVVYPPSVRHRHRSRRRTPAGIGRKRGGMGKFSTRGGGSINGVDQGERGGWLG
jgi:hypothetical protein